MKLLLIQLVWFRWKNIVPLCVFAYTGEQKTEKGMGAPSLSFSTRSPDLLFSSQISRGQNPLKQNENAWHTGYRSIFLVLFKSCGWTLKENVTEISTKPYFYNGPISHHGPRCFLSRWPLSGSIKWPDGIALPYDHPSPIVTTLILVVV